MNFVWLSNFVDTDMEYRKNSKELRIKRTNPFLFLPKTKKSEKREKGKGEREKEKKRKEKKKKRKKGGETE